MIRGCGACVAGWPCGPCACSAGFAQLRSAPAPPGGAPGGTAVIGTLPADGTLFVRDSSGAVSSKVTEKLKVKG